MSHRLRLILAVLSASAALFGLRTCATANSPGPSDVDWGWVDSRETIDDPLVHTAPTTRVSAAPSGGGRSEIRAKFYDVTTGYMVLPQEIIADSPVGWSSSGDVLVIDVPESDGRLLVRAQGYIDASLDYDLTLSQGGRELRCGLMPDSYARVELVSDVPGVFEDYKLRVMHQEGRVVCDAEKSSVSEVAGGVYAIALAGRLKAIVVYKDFNVSEFVVQPGDDLKVKVPAAFDEWVIFEQGSGEPISARFSLSLSKEDARAAGGVLVESNSHGRLLLPNYGVPLRLVIGENNWSAHSVAPAAEGVVVGPKRIVVTSGGRSAERYIALSRRGPSVVVRDAESGALINARAEYGLETSIDGGPWTGRERFARADVRQGVLQWITYDAREASDGVVERFTIMVEGYSPIIWDDPRSNISSSDCIGEFHLARSVLRSIDIVVEGGGVYRGLVQLRGVETGAIIKRGFSDSRGRVGPFDWYEEDISVRLFNNEERIYSIPRAEMGDSEVFVLRVSIPSGGIRVTGWEADFGRPELISMQDVVFDVSRRAGGDVYFLGLPAGKYRVGPRVADGWYTHYGPSREVGVTAGNLETVHWNADWLSAEEKSGRVVLVGARPAEVCLVPCYDGDRLLIPNRLRDTLFLDAGGRFVWPGCRPGVERFVLCAQIEDRLYPCATVRPEGVTEVALGRLIVQGAGGGEPLAEGHLATAIEKSEFDDINLGSEPIRVQGRVVIGREPLSIVLPVGDYDVSITLDGGVVRRAVRIDAGVEFVWNLEAR